MNITNCTVLVLGGGGLVGTAVCRKLVEEHPKRIIVSALTRKEADDAVRTLQREFPKASKNLFVPWWGNIFVRQSLKDKKRDDIMADPAKRRLLIEDTLDALTEDVLQRSTLNRLLHHYRPDIIVDCINSATAIAYQDIFTSARTLLHELREPKKRTSPEDRLVEATERLLCTLYTPQLIRHVQILYRSMHDCGTSMYVKIGTSGTGGMGLNIPYTHSEERPSSVLLSKSVVAGAHTLLLFLMGRTPDAPITKEVKPTAAIAWKRVAFGEIRKHGKPIELYDCPPAKGTALNGTLKLHDPSIGKPLGRTLKSVFIDTGENGLFSRGEFEAISTPGQMEFVTPEEIAENVIYEIRGGNTGHDIINALDNATLSPTYRAGYLFQSAMEKIAELEKEHGIDSVAFEMLGPPRLSKLLYEAYLLKRCFRDMRAVLQATPEAMSQKLAQKIAADATLRAQIISIGIPILMPDGHTLLRAQTIKIPANLGQNVVPLTPRSIDLWAHDGWVDLRTKNMKQWKARLERIRSMVEGIARGDTSSRHLNTSEYWGHFREIDPGKLAGWIFSYEERGMRMKA